MTSKQSFLIKKLSRLLRIPTSKLTAENRFKNDPGLADWEMLWLVNKLEQRYHIEIGDTDLPMLNTPESLESIIMKNKLFIK